MKAKSSFSFILLSAIAVLSGSIGATASSPRIRNVLFIMGDDHSADVLGCYGNRMIRTPNLDRLASQGFRFTRAYTNSPVCTPSRQSIITGKLPHAAGVTLLQTALADEQETIAEHLKRFGFATGAIGKMHFNSDLKHGFDHRVDRPDYRRFLAQNTIRRPAETTRVKPPWRPFQDPARVWLNAEGLPLGISDQDSEGTYFAKQANDFLRANKDNRFCLWLSFYEPHSPFDFPIEYAGKYDPAKMSVPGIGPEDARWMPAVFKDLTHQDRQGIIASYYSSVEYLDKNVGLVLDGLKSLGLEQSTLVVYVGDHGYLLGHHGRFEKHMMWEPAVRAPLIVRAGTSPAPGSSSDALVEFIDLAPTILEVLEVRTIRGLQGKSLAPLLAGNTRHHRDHVFSEFLVDNMAMVRTESWKYIFTTGKNDLGMGYATGNPAAGVTHLLYDIRVDPGETKNLAGDRKLRGVLEKLQGLMLRRFRETHPKAREIPAGLNREQELAWFCEPPEK
jgi:arylsulfatase A-like enzyme